MKFKITQREGDFRNLNTRNENHGSEKVPAADISILCRGGKRDFDMLFPLQEGKLSDVIWDEKGNLQAPYMSPLKNHRTPENVTFTVWDQLTSRAKPLEFEGCKVKIGDVILHEKRNFYAKLMVQLHDDPERDTARLRRLIDTKKEFTLEAQQEDFFDEDPDEEKDKSGQGTLPVETEQGDGDGEGEEAEEEEAEEDEDE